MGTSKDGYTHNPDGTYSYKGQVIQGAKSLGEARTLQGRSGAGGSDNPAATGGGSAGPAKLPNTSSSSFSSAPSSYQSDFQNNPAWIGQAALGSNSDISNPFGGQTTRIDPTTGQAITNYTLSDNNRNVVTNLQNNANTSGADLSHSLNQGVFNNYSGATDANGAVTQDPYTASVFGQLTNNLQKRQTQDQTDLQDQLVNRGIPIGSDEYNREMGQLHDQYANDWSQAQNQAVTSGASMQNSTAQTLQGINAQGYQSPNWQASVGGYNPNMYTSPTQVGQVFGTLANQGLAAQAQMVGAQAQQQNAGTAATQAGFGDAITNWLIHQGQGGAGPAGSGVPTQ